MGEEGAKKRHWEATTCCLHTNLLLRSRSSAVVAYLNIDLREGESLGACGSDIQRSTTAASSWPRAIPSPISFHTAKRMSHFQSNTRFLAWHTHQPKVADQTLSELHAVQAAIFNHLSTQTTQQKPLGVFCDTCAPNVSGPLRWDFHTQKTASWHLKAGCFSIFEKTWTPDLNKFQVSTVKLQGIGKRKCILVPVEKQLANFHKALFWPNQLLWKTSIATLRRKMKARMWSNRLFGLFLKLTTLQHVLQTNWLAATYMLDLMNSIFAHATKFYLLQTSKQKIFFTEQKPSCAKTLERCVWKICKQLVCGPYLLSKNQEWHGSRTVCSYNSGTEFQLKKIAITNKKTNKLEQLCYKLFSSPRRMAWMCIDRIAEI